MLKINKAIKILIYSDFLLQSGWGLIGPIFAIFLTKQIQGGNLKMVGIVAAVFWITKSVVQPFIAHQMDKNHGEKDDFLYLIVGMYVANLVPLGYIFSSQPWHIYVLEFIRGVAMAAVYPSWTAIFTRHINKGREAFSWSMESTSLGFAAGIASVCGAWLASIFGFKIVFVLVSVFGLLSSSVLLLIRDLIFKKDGFVSRLPPAEEPF
jgi:MFS family permease